MSSENRAERQRKFSDQGVVEFTTPGSADRRKEIIRIFSDLVQEVEDGSGQVIVAGGITDRQKRHLIVHVNRQGIRPRVSIHRGVLYHNGEALVRGTRILVSEKTSRKAG